MFGRHIVRADMHPVCPGGERHIDSIVDDKNDIKGRQNCFYGTRLFDHGAGIAFFVAQLNQRCSTCRNRAGEIEQVVPAGALGIDNGVEP